MYETRVPHLKPPDTEVLDWPLLSFGDQNSTGELSIVLLRHTPGLCGHVYFFPQLLSVCKTALQLLSSIMGSYDIF